jgi:hypothetical protein
MAIIILSVICVLPHMGLGSIWTPNYRNGKVSYTCSVFTYQTEEQKKIFHLIYMFLGLLLVAGIIISNIVVAGAVLLLRHRTIEAQKSRSNQPDVSMSTEIKFAIIIEKVGGERGIVFPIWIPSYDLLKNVPFELDKYMLSIRNSNILITSFYV